MHPVLRLRVSWHSMVLLPEPIVPVKSSRPFAEPRARAGARGAAGMDAGGTRGVAAKGGGRCDRLDGGEFRSRLFLALGQHAGLELRYDIIDSGLNCKYRSSHPSSGPICNSEDVARAAFRAPGLPLRMVRAASDQGYGDHAIAYVAGPGDGLDK